MIRRIVADELTPLLRRLSGRRLYLHVEVTPGGFMRNIATDVEEIVLRSDGPAHRIALRCADQGWVVMEGLTHMAIGDGAPLMLCTLVEEDRLTRVIQLSEEAFAA